MSFFVPPDYFEVKPTGISAFQTMAAYLGGSAIQTIGDNPVTAYRQLVQQYAKDLKGNAVDPKVAVQEANAVFKKSPVSAGLSGLGPRLVGVLFKRVPKFGLLLGISFFIDAKGGDVGMIAATGASIFSAPFINPIRMIEKQQRAYFKQTGAQKPIAEIMREAAAQNYKPLFRGTVPLMGHSLASATLGLVGQPKLQKYIKEQVGSMGVPSAVCGLIASSAVSPIYVALTNPLSRLEVIMQTSSIKGERISLTSALKEMASDMRQFGLRGVFRGQGIGIAKAIVSLTMFHEGRIMLTDQCIAYNRRNNLVPGQKQ